MVQTYLKNHPLSKVDKIIMLSPPNHGSPLANALQNNRLAQRILGPTLQELTTQHPAASFNGHYKIGIIAGNKSVNPFGGLFFHEPNDGIVPVSSMRMQEMSDFRVVPVTHTFIMRNDEVMAQIICFLKQGHFCRNK